MSDPHTELVNEFMRIMLRNFTPEQLHILGGRIDEVARHGFGNVKIVWLYDKANLILCEKSDKLLGNDR